jgi:hypothetical protein
VVAIGAPLELPEMPPLRLRGPFGFQFGLERCDDKLDLLRQPLVLLLRLAGKLDRLCHGVASQFKAYSINCYIVIILLLMAATCAIRSLLANSFRVFFCLSG